jgi:hypothetical protein
VADQMETAAAMPRCGDDVECVAHQAVDVVGIEILRIDERRANSPLVGAIAKCPRRPVRNLAVPEIRDTPKLWRSKTGTPS